MTARPIPVRYWRRHGTGPLPSGAEALVEPFNAFPSWCAVRPGAHGEPSARGEVRDILAKMRHDGWGGRAGNAELLSGVEGVSSRPVRRIVLRDG